MKYLKMLGLAAVAAMALMAVGASSASAATTFYSTGVPLSDGTEVHATLEGGTFALSTTDGKTLVDTCTSSTIAGKGGTSESGEEVITAISTLTLSGCTVTTDVLTKGTLRVSSAGTVTGTGTVVTVNFGGVSCRYGSGGGTHLGTLGTGTLTINGVVEEQAPKSFICPDTTKWTANFAATSPHDLTVGSE